MSRQERPTVTLMPVGPGCYATPDRRFRVSKLPGETGVSKRESGWEVVDTTGCRLIGNGLDVSNRAKRLHLAQIRRDIEHVLWLEALVAERDARKARQWA